MTGPDAPIRPTTPPQPRDSRDALKLFLQRWAITTLGVLVAANVLRGIHYETIEGLFIASLLLGALNAFFGRLKLVLGCLTLGVFALVLNALLLMLVGALVEPFHVDGFWTAFWGGVVISLVSVVVAALTGARISPVRGSFHFETHRHSGRPGRPDRDDDDPPIIDV